MDTNLEKTKTLLKELKEKLAIANSSTSSKTQAFLALIDMKTALTKHFAE